MFCSALPIASRIEIPSFLPWSDPGEAVQIGKPATTTQPESPGCRQGPARQRPVRPEARPNGNQRARLDPNCPVGTHHSLLDPAAPAADACATTYPLKAAHPDRVLLYAWGNFFEFFFEGTPCCSSRLLGG